MTPLIDADILLHEIGWSGEFKDKESGEQVLLSVDHVFDLLEDKVRLICEDVGATTAPILFITSSPWIVEQANKLLGTNYKPAENIRYQIAKTKPYKGTRKNPKPFHYKNLVLKMLLDYDVVVSIDGLEADDMLCIEQVYMNKSHKDSVICSRDKDLRICPGWHYSWECGKQFSIGPTYTDDFGFLTEDYSGKTLGYGKKFFYYQMLVGDTADNIPGLQGVGDKGARKLLDPLETEWEVFSAVQKKYVEVLKDTGIDIKEFFLEQADLLWMRQERNKGYEFPRQPK